MNPKPLASEGTFLKQVYGRFIPRSRFEIGILAYVVICAITPWAVSLLLHPADPLPVHVFYRSPEGDIDYFSLINAVSRGEFGDFSVYESHDAGLQSFPIASIFIHVLSVLVFGTFGGYVVADVVVTVFFFFLFREWCRLFSSDKHCTNFIAALFISGLPRFLPLTYHLWGLRIPRPFVSDLYFISGLTLFVFLCRFRHHLSRKWPWLCLGVIFSLALQSYIYYLPVFAAAFFYIVSIWVLEDKTRWTPAFVGMVEFGMAFLLSSAFFIYQRLHTAPNALAHLGVFPVDRLMMWTYRPWIAENHSCFTSVFAVLGLFLSSLFAKRFNIDPLPGRVLGLLLFLPIVSLFAVPISATLTGKLIQPYHYSTVSGAILSCTVFALIVYSGQFPLRSLNQPVRSDCAWLILISALVATPLLEIHARQHLAAEEGPNSRQGASYRAAFVNLTRELNRDIYRNDQVIATSDDWIYTYWVGFINRYTFLPDTFTSPLPDRSLEDRVLWYAREVNISEDSLVLFLDRYPTLIALGHDFYQCSSLYHESSLDDYSPQDLKRNLSLAPSLWTWNLALPLSVSHRLSKRYREILAMPETAKPRLDLIVITADAGGFALPSPDTSRYKLTYHDEYYSVWQAIK